MGEITYKNSSDKLNILVIGAHPDDSDINCSGSAVKWAALGHNVTFVSLTNGNAGHHELSPKDLEIRRRAESQAAAKVYGVNYIVMNNDDGKLQADLETRGQLIKLIREQRPNIILTNRPNDYHADHRNVGILVQDAAYLVAVPSLYPETPRLDYNPVILYWYDYFQKPTPFKPDVFVDVTDVIDRKAEGISMHSSQVFEWLPFVERMSEKTPTDKSAQIEWIKSKRWCTRVSPEQYISELSSLVGTEKASQIKFLEAFERCEYGAKLTPENFAELFPFAIRNF